MKLYKKIDLFFNGDYVCSTNQSKTCKQAVNSYLESISRRARSYGVGLVEEQIYKYPNLLKARFSK